MLAFTTRYYLGDISILSSVITNDSDDRESLNEEYFIINYFFKFYNSLSSVFKVQVFIIVRTSTGKLTSSATA